MKYLSVGVAAGFFFSSLLLGAADAGNTIKVGIVDTYTGPNAPFAGDVLDGFRLAVSTINAGGGVLGKRIEYMTRDDRSKPDAAFNLARELIERKRVDILLGTSDGASYLAVSDLCGKERVPFFATGYPRRGYQTPSDRKRLRYTFHVNETAEMAGRAAAVGLSAKNYTTYWIAGDDSEYGHALTESLWGSLKRLKPGVRFIGQTWWKDGVKEYRHYISDIARGRPDCIIFASPSGIVDFQNAAASMGLSIPMYQHRAIDQSSLTRQGPAAQVGVMGTSGYLFYYPETAQNRAFVDDFRRTYHRYPGAGAFYGYVTARFISEAYLKSAATDRERFIDALEGLVVDTPSGNAEMSAAEHQALLPVFFGALQRDDQYPDFLVAGEIVTVAPRGSDPAGPPAYAYAQRPVPLEVPIRKPVPKPVIERADRDSNKPARKVVAQTADIGAIPSFRKEQKVFGENDVAIVIGIEHYRKNLPRSSYSSNDARTVKAYLEALGFAPRNIQYLSDEDATRSDIQKSVEGWLPGRVRKESRVFIYYSGHGAPDPVSGDAYLVPYDGDPQYLKETAYSLGSLYERLGRLQAREIMVVLDTCFSGMGGRSVLAYGVRPLVLMAPLTAPPSNVVVLTASGGNQITASSGDKEFGIFTYYFLKAIKDGKKSMAEIYEYLKPLVEDEAKRLNVDQTPGINPDPDKLKGRFLIARSGGRT